MRRHPRSPAVRTRPRLLAAAALATCLALTACGGGDDTSTSSDSPSADETTRAAAPQTSPLTGLKVTGSGEEDYPVMVLKMDNTEASSPQLGLGTADMVVEELVEGGSTRLAAFYYSQIPGNVGPVRSMRASDIGIVSPVGGTMVTSGAAAVTISRLKDAGVDYVTEGSDGFYRDDSRSAPYNLFTNMTDVAKELSGGKPTRPDDYLPWGSESDFPQGQPATSIDAVFSGGHTTSWSYDGQGYVNEDTFAAQGDEFPADSVLVLRVDVGDAGYLDPAGNPVPETKFVGSGDAQLFHDGQVVDGTWTKDELTSDLQLSAKGGGKLTVPAGHTWIELVPNDGGDVTFQK